MEPPPPQSGASRHRGRQSNTARDASQCGLGRDANAHVCCMLLPASLGLPGISCFFSRSAMPVGTGLLFLLAAALLDQLHLSELSVAAVAVGLIAFQLAALPSGAVFGMPPGVGPGTRFVVTGPRFASRCQTDFEASCADYRRVRTIDIAIYR